jgi:hypothetical protein
MPSSRLASAHDDGSIMQQSPEGVGGATVEVHGDRTFN